MIAGRGVPRRRRPSIAIRLACASILAGVFALAPSPAGAGTEEFSTFDIEAQEEDDESLLDHLLTRPPREWRDEWERAPQAIRTSQGCLTSGQWFIDTDLKLRAPLGRRAQFGVDLKQSESDIASYQYLDFSFRFPTAFGVPGAMFRPLYDKSRQDFALTWETGADTTALQLQAVFTFEDVFNNFWAFRQTRVGGTSEAYERHPYEPGIRMVSRNEAWRAELLGRTLTPSRKSVVDPASGGRRVVTLWGTLASAALEARALGLEWELRGGDKQATSSEAPSDFSTPVDRNFRRQWTAELAARRQITPRLAAETRWLVQERRQIRGPDVGARAIGASDRVAQLEARYALHPAVSLRLGGLYDHITVHQTGAPVVATHGSRTESRAYLGLTARFGQVSVHAVEGIELDPEPYEVWLVHDKAFLHLQTAF